MSAKKFSFTRIHYEDIMKSRTQLLLLIAAVAAAIVVLLFVNKSRLDASADRIDAKPAAVTVVRATRQVVPVHLSSIGVLRAYSDVPVIAETQGKVLKRYVDVGDVIRAGAPIVKVDTLVKYAAFVAAKTAYAKAKSDLARFKALHDEGNTSNSEVELAELNVRSAEAQYQVARRQYEDADICAPISGEVAERSVDVGMMVTPGATIAVVVDVSRLKITIAVSENDISRIRKGMSVSATLDAYPGTRFSGIVQFIAPKASESLLFPVQIVIPNNRQFPLKAGMTARITFDMVTEEHALLIPRTALVGSAREGKVFVVENNIACLRSVTVGGEYGLDVAVRTGLSEGERVVTVGKNTIRAGAPVTIIH
jgi:membrane fusion protein, multidrug efflux system